MNTAYQLIFLGNESPFRSSIESVFFQHTSELGLDIKSIEVIDQKNFTAKYIANAPTFCLYFGDENSVFKNLDEIKRLISDATLILPVVEEIEKFSKHIPSELHSINGTQLKNQAHIEPLVGSILEGLGLLRLTRRLFISYKRDESSSVAIQLFERFEKAGFDVFLDTHSIRPGNIFQEELWHRLADTDIVVLLNTKKFLESSWTAQELAQANSMSIGLLQVIWPDNIPERAAEISLPFKLEKSFFNNDHYSDVRSYLDDKTLDILVSKAESLRARSLAARQDNIITEFIKSAKKLKIDVTIQPEKFLTMINKKGEEVVIIPTVGVPQAFTYNQSEELVKRIKTNGVSAIYLLYDHLNIRKKWLIHLAWLDTYLPIKTIKLLEREEWLQNN
jgi:hypothetical protein